VFIVCGPTTNFSPPSLHDALPIYGLRAGGRTAFLESRTGTGGHPFLKVRPNIVGQRGASERAQSNDHREEHTHHYFLQGDRLRQDRKSTRLNSSHVKISYAVFCLK